MTSWRNADCREVRRNRLNEARERKKGGRLCVWQEWKDRSRVREQDEKELTEIQKTKDRKDFILLFHRGTQSATGVFF